MALRARDRAFFETDPLGFVPIPFDRYVELHLGSHPDENRDEFVRWLRRAVDDRKAGVCCACGAPIGAIGSAQAGNGCFTCLTGEAPADDDHEIDEALET